MFFRFYLITLKDMYKGILFGLISLISVGIQPIIANSRPESIDALFFATITCIYQALFFLPFMLFERRRIKSEFKSDLIVIDEYNSYLHGWKKNLKFLIFVGVNFALSQFFYFLGYQLTGNINGSLVLKTTIFFGLIFGVVINREKTSFLQIIFSIFLFFGVFLAITQGSFNLLEFNLGAIFLLITSLLWMLAHAITKPILERKELTSSNLVFIRNGLNSVILLIFYFIFYPDILQTYNLIFDPINQVFYLLFASLYALDLWAWYKAIQYIEVSKATALMSLTPIITASVATIFLNELFTLFHLIGSIIITGSIVIIMRSRKKCEEKS
jgi:drug/metabolite transporter (DMT)-like permease